MFINERCCWFRFSGQATRLCHSSVKELRFQSIILPCLCQGQKIRQVRLTDFLGKPKKLAGKLAAFGDVLAQVLEVTSGRVAAAQTKSQAASDGQHSNHASENSIHKRLGNT